MLLPGIVKWFEVHPSQISMWNALCTQIKYVQCSGVSCSTLVAFWSFGKAVFLRQYPKLPGNSSSHFWAAFNAHLPRQEKARRAGDSCLQGHRLHKSSFIHSGCFMEAWPLEIKTQYVKEYPWKCRRHRRCQLSAVVCAQLFTILLHRSSVQRDVAHKVCGDTTARCKVLHHVTWTSKEARGSNSQLKRNLCDITRETTSRSPLVLAGSVLDNGPYYLFLF